MIAINSEKSLLYLSDVLPGSGAAAEHRRLEQRQQLDADGVDVGLQPRRDGAAGEADVALGGAPFLGAPPSGVRRPRPPLGGGRGLVAVQERPAHAQALRSVPTGRANDAR